MSEKESQGSKKVQLLLWIDESVDSRFRELISQKYKKYEKGQLSYEGELALRSWLSLHTPTQENHINTPNPVPKVQLKFAKIKQFLGDGVYQDLHSGQQVPIQLLKRAIENVIGNDPRTIKKYMKLFNDNGLIKHVTGNVWEIM
jgi:hypothetical protein